MVRFKRKKVVKYRGSKTHGCGSMKKRRGAGNRGGRGLAGSGKRGDSKKPSIWKKKYFGKHGFKSKNNVSINSINLKDLEIKFDTLLSKQLIRENNGKYEINLSEMGFQKLLGSGKLSKKLSIIVNSCSPRALEKVQAAGGEVILPSSNNSKEE